MRPTASNEESERPIPIVGPYFLISFDPSSGIGMYEFREVTHIFDPVPGRGVDLARRLDGVEQVEAGIYFNSWDDLISFCTREYFKHKKDTYYGALFTKQLGRNVFAKAIKFLNEPRLEQITISRMVVSLLKEVADSRRVCAVLVQAHEHELKNMQKCLSSELREIVLSPEVLKTLKRATPHAEKIITWLSGQAGSTALPQPGPTFPGRS